MGICAWRGDRKDFGAGGIHLVAAESAPLEAKPGEIHSMGKRSRGGGRGADLRVCVCQLFWETEALSFTCAGVLFYVTHYPCIMCVCMYVDYWPALRLV